MAAACGGSESPRPAPLTTRFDEMYIAQIAPEAKPEVVTSQNEYQVARMTHAKAQADLADADVQLSVSQNDHKQAKLVLDSANSQKKAADLSADVGRINDATKELRAAELGVKAAAERVTYLRTAREYLKVNGELAEEDMYFKESKFELAKARLAQANNIAPKGYDFTKFQAQETTRDGKVKARRSQSDAAKRRALAARARWLGVQVQADQLNGRTGILADPLAGVAN